MLLKSIFSQQNTRNKNGCVRDDGNLSNEWGDQKKKTTSRRRRRLQEEEKKKKKDLAAGEEKERKKKRRRRKGEEEDMAAVVDEWVVCICMYLKLIWLDRMINMCYFKFVEIFFIYFVEIRLGWLFRSG